MLEYAAVSQYVDMGGNEGGRRMSNGIAAYLEGKLVDTIRDITPDAEEVRRLAGMLNRFGASLLHFHDMVEDYIVQREAL